MVEPQSVLIQPLPRWDGAAAADSILGSHFGTADYLLASQRSTESDPFRLSYKSNEDVWRDIVKQPAPAGVAVVLECFHLSDWFPRAPGLYYTREAEFARDEAFRYLHHGFGDSPIRDHAHRTGERARGRDHTVVFTPEGKLSMLQGGIGSVRLKPIHVFGVPHMGVPIALPRRLYTSLLAPLQQRGAVCATISGELEFVPDPFSRLFDRSVMVPRLLLRVMDLSLCERSSHVTLETSVAASFVSAYQGSPRIYVTYVTFRPDVEGSFEDAVSWMKNEYVEGEYEGRIITDFDQTRTIFPEARLALSSVMDRLISRGELRDTIELMHATATVDSYFDEIARQALLPGKHKAHRTKIFISYAHAAEKETGWVGRIRTHLEGVAQSSDLEVWDDTRIEPGQKWQEQIEQAISRARVAVLVLTADFLASKYVREAELPPLLEAADADGATILCVYGSDVHLSGIASRLLRYQFVNKPERPLQALSKAGRESIYKELSRAVEKALEK